MRKIPLVKRIVYCFLVAILSVLFACSPQVRSFKKEKFTTARNIPANIERWEKTIESFEQADKIKKPKKGSILFVGSSSIVKWENLKKQFPNKYILNRGLAVHKRMRFIIMLFGFYFLINPNRWLFM